MIPTIIYSSDSTLGYHFFLTTNEVILPTLCKRNHRAVASRKYVGFVNELSLLLQIKSHKRDWITLSQSWQETKYPGSRNSPMTSVRKVLIMCHLHQVLSWSHQRWFKMGRHQGASSFYRCTSSPRTEKWDVSGVLSFIVVQETLMFLMFCVNSI